MQRNKEKKMTDQRYTIVDAICAPHALAKVPNFTSDIVVARIANVLWPDLNDIILAYSKPLETPDLILVLETTQKWNLYQWIASRQVLVTLPPDNYTKSKCLVDGMLHSLSSDENHYARFVEQNGASAKEWYCYGRLHRDNDLPAHVHSCGYKAWYRYGSWHREGGGPAQIFQDGRRKWHLNGFQFVPKFVDGKLHWLRQKDGRYASPEEVALLSPPEPKPRPLAKPIRELGLLANRRPVPNEPVLSMMRC